MYVKKRKSRKCYKYSWQGLSMRQVKEEGTEEENVLTFRRK